MKPHPLRRHLWFERAGHRFASPMEYLQEVLPKPTLRRLPAGEASLAGLMTLRDQILPVFDPWLLASSVSPSSDSSGAVLILGQPGEPILGLLADRVGKVIELPDILPFRRPARLPLAFAGECQDRLQGRMLVLDPAALAEAMGLTAPGAALAAEAAGQNS